MRNPRALRMYFPLPSQLCTVFAMRLRPDPMSETEGPIGKSSHLAHNPIHVWNNGNCKVGRQNRFANASPV